MLVQDKPARYFLPCPHFLPWPQSPQCRQCHLRPRARRPPRSHRWHWNPQPMPHRCPLSNLPFRLWNCVLHLRSGCSPIGPAQESQPSTGRSAISLEKSASQGPSYGVGARQDASMPCGSNRSGVRHPYSVVRTTPKEQSRTHWSEAERGTGCAENKLASLDQRSYSVKGSRDCRGTFDALFHSRDGGRTLCGRHRVNQAPRSWGSTRGVVDRSVNTVWKRLHHTRRHRTCHGSSLRVSHSFSVQPLRAHHCELTACRVSSMPYFGMKPSSLRARLSSTRQM